jgi:A/G-specific adenine glycosylase
MNPRDRETLQSKIFTFYSQNRRRFPWRETTDRYLVMVSEIMLQQTQAERVVSRFAEWRNRFPDIVSLSEAPLRDVLQLWSGLGYNSRAQRLHRCASIIVDEHEGVVPADPAVLKRLPGIGAYTSHSIPVFADNADIVAVDTNIRRILIHELKLPETISPADLQSIAEELLPLGRSRQWHNALMDYGSLFLTSRRTGISPLTKQSTFKGSRRWYRGRIVRDLLAEGMLLRSDLESRYEGCPHNISSILDGLLGEGMVEQVYGSGPDGGEEMVRIAGNG